MSTEPARAAPDWLALRESADAAARSTELVDVLRAHLPTQHTVVHDLGCGTGSMARWLAPRLDGAQQWVLHDRDAELLAIAADVPLPRTRGGRPSLVTRQDDITRLAPRDLEGVSLVTASALLDMFTWAELDRFVSLCTHARCPVLITLSVVGHVEVDPPDPLDGPVMEAFNDHQRRRRSAAPLLGPEAAWAAVAGFRQRGFAVEVRPTPWHVGPDHRDLALAWFAGWLAAACEQVPSLADVSSGYASRRRSELARGSASVIVHHVDLLALPGAPRRARGG